MLLQYDQLGHLILFGSVSMCVGMHIHTSVFHAFSFHAVPVIEVSFGLIGQFCSGVCCRSSFRFVFLTSSIQTESRLKNSIQVKYFSQFCVTVVSTLSHPFKKIGYVPKSVILIQKALVVNIKLVHLNMWQKGEEDLMNDCITHGQISPSYLLLLKWPQGWMAARSNHSFQVCTMLAPFVQITCLFS